MSSTDIWVLPAIAWLVQKLKQALENLRNIKNAKSNAFSCRLQTQTIITVPMVLPSHSAP